MSPELTPIGGDFAAKQPIELKPGLSTTLLKQQLEAGELSPAEIQAKLGVTKDDAIKALYATVGPRATRIALLTSSAIGGYREWDSGRIFRLIAEFEAREIAVQKVLTALRAELAAREKLGDAEFVKP